MVASPVFRESMSLAYEHVRNSGGSILTDKKCGISSKKKYTACGLNGKNVINDYVDLRLKA